jgi:hypothetical protein
MGTIEIKPAPTAYTNTLINNLQLSAITEECTMYRFGMIPAELECDVVFLY